MRLRDISIWGFFKLILVIDYLIAIIITPLIILAAFLFGDGRPKIKIDKQVEMKAAGGTIDFGEFSLIPAIIAALFIGFVAIIIKSWVLVLICKFTPIGRIDVGKF